MKIITSTIKDQQLPFRIFISFEKIFDYIKLKMEDPFSPYQQAAKSLLESFEKYPELTEGFEDFSLLEKYEDQINILLDALFPELLAENEIKAASVPFDFTIFKLSRRLESIMKEAGDAYEFKMRNFEEDKMYILTCVFILQLCHNYSIDFKRPIFFDIPNEKTGTVRHYRAMFNADFSDITPTDTAPEITPEIINELLDSFDNVEVWKKYFPPGSYTFKGFALLTLFDVTNDENLSKLKDNLLHKDATSFAKIQKNLQQIFSVPNLRFGFSIYNKVEKKMQSIMHEANESVILLDEREIVCDRYFCEGVMTHALEKHQILAISDVDKYAERSGNNGFSKNLKSKGVNSIILAPFDVNEEKLGILELSSQNKYELNSVNANKLKDVIPMFTVSAQRAAEEFQTKIESVIQDHYTAIHPSVKWKFLEAADNYLFEESKGVELPRLNEIVFEDIYPIYGQCDIKGSSVARNKAIQKDLIKQLSMAISVMKTASKVQQMPIYDDLSFRIDTYLRKLNKGIKTGDEVNITDFLKRDIYPVFRHLKTVDESLASAVDNYMSQIDEKLHVVYDERKKYENSVTLLNEKLAGFIDNRQEAAQGMFPHYFERYKTDGVEYNMYIGQSLVKSQEFNPVYLHNLRLWQLQIMCEMENVVHHLRDDMEHKLEIASLILVHSSPLAIRFRMDEKQFDVDGAYNIRYEIIKKRIDKAYIKDTNERLTQPGKIAIVYAQEKDAKEYLKYIKFLQSKKYLTKNVEMLDLEELQGISGLKAIRVEVVYDKLFKTEMTSGTLDSALKEANLTV